MKPTKKTLHISSELDFWFHSKKTRYFSVSNTLQDFFKKTDVFASFSTDHSPVFSSFGKGNDSVCGRGLWKINKSLISGSRYIKSMKKYICETLCLLDNQEITDEQLRWEYLKYEIRKSTKRFVKATAGNARKETDFLEMKLKHVQADLKKYPTSQKYLDCKSKLDEIYSKKLTESG